MSQSNVGDPSILDESHLLKDTEMEEMLTDQTPYKVFQGHFQRLSQKVATTVSWIEKNTKKGMVECRMRRLDPATAGPSNVGSVTLLLPFNTLHKH